ncbi:MAG TPA: MBL fold metallo-hydrolase [Kofleriaceae bacterium]|nr:MBL fold metallo-hydrolase [Kofleriaceae bacterium]
MPGPGLAIRFLGAAETVTGSRYLVEAGGARVLVECGLFQGWKKLRLRNWAPLPVEPSSLDAVVLTHAHIDHSGYLPRLCTLGFAGPVYCTQGTADLLRILLPDCGHLQEEEARHANLRGYSKHSPALPLYTREDAERSLDRLVAVPYREEFAVAAGVAGRFTRAGHIIGSACLHLQAGATGIAFTGDVGRPEDPIMRPPDPLPRADVLVTESTYGDRRHPPGSAEDAVAQVIERTVEKRGALIVPAFAVGRAQHLLHVVTELAHQRRIPDLPIFLDSPMAIDATGLFFAHAGEHRLTPEQCRRIAERVRYTRTAEESKAIDLRDGPMIVISASGMATGGRVLHHLRRFLPDERSCVLFAGYQPAGTRGRSLVDGADEIKIHGQYVPVRARVEQIECLSAHADYRELLDWLARADLAPRDVFVTHGEPAAADAFRRRLRDRFGWDATVPDQGETALL